MPIGPARMPLFDHLGELRMRLVRIVACLAIAVCVFYLAADTIAMFLILPIQEYLPGDVLSQQLYVQDPFEGFAIRFKLALWASLIACSPVIIWQLLAFFLPALKPSERKWFIPTFAVAVALFIFGAVFCYFIILDKAFEWLIAQGAEFATILPRADTFLDTIIKFELGFGFAFELPLIVFYLVIFDVVPYKKLRNSWRTVYVALMVISAMVTPDASPVTMLLMFAALIALYEISLLISRLVLGKRIKEQTAAYEAAQAEEQAWKEEQAAKKAEKKAEEKAARKEADKKAKARAK